MALEPLANPIYRTATSRYTTAEQSTLEDLKCQICLCTLSKCVAIEPCGHNFCATCLSHHFGSQLQGGLQISCPFRCPPPERIIINYAVRALVELLEHSGHLQPQHSIGSTAGSSLKPPTLMDGSTASSPLQRTGSTGLPRLGGASGTPHGGEGLSRHQRASSATEDALAMAMGRPAAPAPVEALRQQHVSGRRVSSPASPSR